MLMLMFLVTAFLIFYHHILYPVILKYFTEKFKPSGDHFSEDKDLPGTLPSITVIMPAYNEQKFIMRKLENLLKLDYPKEKLSIEVISDGCSDKTVCLTQRFLKDKGHDACHIHLIKHDVNRGKTTVLNEAVNNSNSDIIVLTDVSALIPSDSLRKFAVHFINPKVGGVSAAYNFIQPSEVEEVYWSYQSTIKKYESRFGSVLGCHGALYAIRRNLFMPIDNAVINDDFILPMRVVEQGFRVIYDHTLVALELENASLDQDFNRRKRISAGNMQQMIMLRKMLLPQYGWVAFNFISGKALRACTPFLLLILFIETLLLSFDSIFMTVIFLGQLITYLSIFFTSLMHINIKHKILKVIHYLVIGHWAGLLGGCRYFFGLKKVQWAGNTGEI